MAWTPMACLPWMSRTHSWVRRYFLQIRYMDNLGRFSSFILQMYAVCTHYALCTHVCCVYSCMLCVLIRITSMRNYASWYGMKSNPPWLELPLSWTNFYGPKGVWAVKVRLYTGLRVWKGQILFAFNKLFKIVADRMLNLFFLFSWKVSCDIFMWAICMHMIHMKWQALYLLENKKRNILKCLLLL